MLGDSGHYDVTKASGADAIVQLYPGLNFSNVSAWRSNNDLFLRAGASSLQLTNFFLDPQAWTFEDSLGDTTTAAALLSASSPGLASGGQFSSSEFATDGVYSTSSIGSNGGEPTTTFFNGQNVVTGSTTYAIPTLTQLETDLDVGYGGSVTVPYNYSLAANFSDGTQVSAQTVLGTLTYEFRPTFFTEESVTQANGVVLTHGSTSQTFKTNPNQPSWAGDDPAWIYSGDGGYELPARLPGYPVIPYSGQILSNDYYSTSGTLMYSYTYNPQDPTAPPTLTPTGSTVTLPSVFTQVLTYANGAETLQWTNSYQLVSDTVTTNGQTYSVAYGANGAATYTGNYTLPGLPQPVTIATLPNGETGFFGANGQLVFEGNYSNPYGLFEQISSTDNTLFSATGESINVQSDAGSLDIPNPPGSYGNSQTFNISDGKGDTTQYVYNYDTLTTSWTNADGSMGAGTFDLATHSGTETVTYSNGSYSTATNDGLGGYTIDNYNADGTLASDQWSKSDGSHGTDTFNADGSSSGTAYASDGSYTTYTNGGQGDLTTLDYTAQGQYVGDSWSRGNGSQGTDTFNIATDVFSGNYTLAGATTVAVSTTPPGGGNVLMSSVDNATLAGGTGADSLFGFGANDTLTAGSGGNLLYGSGNDDVLVSGSGNDLLIGTGNSDTLTAGSGNDTLIGAGAGDTFTISDSNTTDAISAAGGTIAVTGTNDTVTASGNDNTLNLGSGSTLTVNYGSDGDVINTSGSTVDLLATSQAVLNGSNDTLSTNAFDTYTINGTGNTVGVGVLDTVTDNGSGNTLDTLWGDDNITFGNDVSATVTGNASGNSLTLGAGDSLTASGNAIHLGDGLALDSLTGNSNTLYAGTNDTVTASGNDNTLNLAGSDTVTVNGGDNTLAVNSSTDVLTVNDSTASNTLLATVSYVLPQNVALLTLTGSGSITGTGNNLSDLLLANTGNDTLLGGTGVGVLEAGGGADVLEAQQAQAALIGSTGPLTMMTGAYNDFFAAGAGGTTVTTGASANIVSFNQGEGAMTLDATVGATDTLSLGDGINYGDLSFSQSGNDLVLTGAGSDAITFKDWYASPANQDVVTLQVLEQAASTYNPSSTNPLYNEKIETFNFANLVAQFDAARVANPTLTSWSLSNGLVAAYDGGSNTAALGGDLAYYFGTQGNLTGMNLAASDATLTDPTFGTAAQTIHPWGTISGQGPTLR